jgi:hypothetical protein
MPPPTLCRVDDSSDGVEGVRSGSSMARLGSWLGELSRMAPGLLQAHVPGGGIDARTREELIITVADANGCRFLEWVHGAWQEFLGPSGAGDEIQPLVDFARASARAGLPLDTTVLDALYPASVVRSARATVARAQIGSVLANATGQLAGSLLSRRPAGPLQVAGQIAAVGVAFPVLAPVAVMAGALRAAVRLAPPVPEPELPADDEANLVVHLLAEALPTYLGHAVVRTVLLWNPVVLAIGVRGEGTGATMRIGQGRVVIVNGIRPDALLVVEGGIEPLLHLASGSIVRQLAGTARRSLT